jgi:putative sporulation protein YyaC
MQFSFNLYNRMAPTGILLSLEKLLAGDDRPVILCVGSDLVAGDSLGPVTGTMISKRCNAAGLADFSGSAGVPFEPCFVYGDLSSPVTAKEVKYAENFLRKTHPGRKILAIDAAVGAAGEVGLIRVQSGGLMPGSGAGKKMGKVGDISILGIVAEKSLFNYTVLNSIRLNVVYQMSSVIAEGISLLLSNAAADRGVERANALRRS